MNDNKLALEVRANVDISNRDRKEPLFDAMPVVVYKLPTMYFLVDVPMAGKVALAMTSGDRSSVTREFVDAVDFPEQHQLFLVFVKPFWDEWTN